MKELLKIEDVQEDKLWFVASEIKKIVKTPAVIILDGVVGAGKTRFSGVFANLSGLTSPTYSVINEYGDVLHADLYRLKTSEELVHLELELYLSDKNYFLVEWGRQYLKELEMFIESRFSFYLLEIEIVQNSDYRIFRLMRVK